jgi:ribosomal subunit interface protein
MIVELVGNHARVSPRMRKLVERKAVKINQFLEGLHFPEEGIRLRAVVDRHPVKSYQVTINLAIPHQQFRAEETGDRFTTALNETVDEVIRQIKRHKAKLKGESSFKEIAKSKRVSP